MKRWKWEECGICCMQGYAGDDQLAEALKGADLVIMPAGVPRKPGMTRDDLFKVASPSCSPPSRIVALSLADFLAASSKTSQ